MRIVVTGGAGFIGSHTVDLLLQNNFQVTVLDNLISGKLSYLNLAHPNLKFIQGDILNFPLLLTLLKECDAVLHLAALPSVIKSIADPLTSFKVNTEGFLHLLQMIRQLNRPIRLVYASSAAVYGNNIRLPCQDQDESSSTEMALSPYALEKANNERYANLYDYLFGMKSLGLRYFNVYGTRQDPKSPYAGVISKFIEYYQQDEPILVFGDGSQSRDFIHVSDVARANLKALQSDCFGVLNIATGKAENLLDLITYIEMAGRKKTKLDFVSARPGDITHSCASTDKAEKYLDFRYETNLREGISSLLKIGYT
ncbi:MAG TPA: NAD-dependent epimerase/dehydratase family protein [Gammaproteobacteria bacterium]|nr:NAD-dependent epimerase/dehydratase family protein [Gammaproteobacteria bacterium]